MRITSELLRPVPNFSEVDMVRVYIEDDAKNNIVNGICFVVPKAEDIITVYIHNNQMLLTHPKDREFEVKLPDNITDTLIIGENSKHLKIIITNNCSRLAQIHLEENSETILNIQRFSPLPGIQLTMEDQSIINFSTPTWVYSERPLMLVDSNNPTMMDVAGDYCIDMWPGVPS